MASKRVDTGRGRRSNEEIKYIHDLPYKVMKELCSIMDMQNLWREIGGQEMDFGLQDLQRFRRAYQWDGNCSSPSQVMLLEWGARNGSVDRLFLILRKMKCRWLMEILHPYISRKYKHLLPVNTGCTTVFREMDDVSRTPEEYSETHISYKEQSLSSCSSNSYKNCSPLKKTSPQSRRDDSLITGTESLNSNDGEKIPNKKSPVEAGVHSSNGSISNDCDYNFNRNGKSNMKTPDIPNASKVSMVSSDGCEKIRNDQPKPPHSIPPPPRASSPVPSTAPVNAPLAPPAPPPQGANFIVPQKLSPDGPGANEDCDMYGSRRRPSDPINAASMSSLSPVSYTHILAATQGFTTKVLGQGGFGKVYKGILWNTEVAIKRIQKKDNPDLAMLEDTKFKQSIKELRMLEICRHDNILALYSYSLTEEGLCLVYQLMPNGSLEDRLMCKNGTKPLTWIQRGNIMRGAARGIQYMHTMGERPFIHGDIKSANILLAKDFEPKIGDFGLVREGPDPEKKYTFAKYLQGTRPYLPFEYLRNKKLSAKVDTYGFGVVLYEVATGLRAYDDKRSKELKNLSDFIRCFNRQNLPILRDRKADDVNSELFEHFMNFGLQCTDENHKKRPEMVHVFTSLDKVVTTVEHYRKGRQGSSPVGMMTPFERQAAYDAKYHQNMREKVNAGVGAPPVAPSPSPHPCGAQLAPNANKNRHATEQTAPVSDESTTANCDRASHNTSPPAYNNAVMEEIEKNNRAAAPSTPVPKQQQQQRVIYEEEAPSCNKVNEQAAPPCVAPLVGLEPCFLPNITLLRQPVRNSAKVSVPPSNTAAVSNQEQLPLPPPPPPPAAPVRRTSPPSPVLRNPSVNDDDDDDGPKLEIPASFAIGSPSLVPTGIPDIPVVIAYPPDGPPSVCEGVSLEEAADDVSMIGFASDEVCDEPPPPSSTDFSGELSATKKSLDGLFGDLGM